MSLDTLRFDRLLSLALFHPLRRLEPKSSAPPLPVLMYHSISEETESGVSPYYKVNTSPDIFRQHMRLLAQDGYQTLDLAQAAQTLGRGQSVAAKSVVITFDDGFRNVLTEAYPVLREHGFTATVFLPTAFISNERRAFKSRECLTWDEVRQLREGGIRFGSHTVNHPELVRLSPDEIACELIESKVEIEQQLGEPVPTFAYPYAFPQTKLNFARDFCALLIKAGYVCCVTTEIGRVHAGDDPYRLKRLPANSLDDPALYRAKLDGGYDWLAVPQSLVKQLRTRGSRSTESQQN